MGKKLADENCSTRTPTAAKGTDIKYVVLPTVRYGWGATEPKHCAGVPIQSYVTMQPVACS